MTQPSNVNDKKATVNLATEEKQDAIVAAIEGITIPAPVGGSTEAKQDAIITAIGEVSQEATQLEIKDLIQLLTDISLSDDKVHLLLQQIRDSIRMPVNYNEATNTTNIAGTVAISSLPTLAVVTNVATVSAVTNQTNLGGFSADLMVENNSRQDWGVTIRSLIQ